MGQTPPLEAFTLKDFLFQVGGGCTTEFSLYFEFAYTWFESTDGLSTNTRKFSPTVVPKSDWLEFICATTSDTSRFASVAIFLSEYNKIVSVNSIL